MQRACEIPSSLKRHPYLKDGALLSVYRQPIALDRFLVYDVSGDTSASASAASGSSGSSPSGGGGKSFVVVQENRFQQMISTVMLEASSEEEKVPRDQLALFLVTV